MSLKGQKILWTEGAMLHQQHMQKLSKQNDESIEHLTSNRDYGIIYLELNTISIQKQKVELNDLELLLPNKQYISLKKSHISEEVLDLNNRTEDYLYLSAKISKEFNVYGIAGYEDSKKQKDEHGWVTEYKEVADEFDNNRKAEIAIAKPVIKLFLEKEIVLEEKSSYIFPLVKFIRTGNTYFLDTDFIPYTLYLNTNQNLCYILNDFIENIDNKIQLIKNKIKGLQYSLQNTIEIAKYYSLLPILGEAHFKLLSLYKETYVTTRSLVKELYMFLGKLNSLAGLNLDTGDINALSLNDNVEYLNNKFEEIFSEIVVTNESFVELKLDEDGFYELTNINKEILLNQSLLLMVTKSSNIDWIKDFVANIRIASSDDIQSIVDLSLEGISIEHLSIPPASVPYNSNFEYFAINRQHVLYENVIKSNSLKLYIPDAYKDKEIKVINVEEE